MMKVGDFISTPYGEAKLKLFREIDKTYVLQLSFGIIYARGDDIFKSAEAKERETNNKKVKRSMELNEAYEALEKMRKLNLELACQECGIAQVDYDECTVCLLDKSRTAQTNTMTGRLSGIFKPKASAISPNMPRLKKFVEEREKRCKPDRCLTCGAPSCHSHSSKEFRSEGITVCNQCKSVFHMDFVVDCLTLNKQERRERIGKMVDMYDRAVLLLNFSGQYIDDVIDGLENTKKKHNKINFGGSSAGIVSGVLGVAAAATILTPAGAPLLIASLMLGTGATAIQTGTDINSKYFSEPNKVADRIIATHGILLSVLSVTGTLRDAATRDYIRTDAFEEESPVLQELRKNHIKNRKVLMAGVTAGRFSLASAELLAVTEGATIARSARMFSRSGTAAMRTLRFARVAGGALAAATLLIEAKCMHSTVQSIQAGSPCEKADALRVIHEDMPDLPKTADLDKECNAYLAYMDQRGRKMMEDEAVQLLLEVSKAAEEEDERMKKEAAKAEAAQLQQQGELILPGEETTAETDTVDSSSNISSSLLERIQSHLKSEHSPAGNDSSENDKIQHGERRASPPEQVLNTEQDDDELSQVTTSTTMSNSTSLLERIEQFKKSRGESVCSSA